jgi:hypothetical protein
MDIFLIDIITSVEKTALKKNLMRIDLATLFGISLAMPTTHRVTPVRLIAAGLSLLTLAIVGLVPVRAHASLPKTAFSSFSEQLLTSIATAPGGGFWVQVDSKFGSYAGGTFAKEGAPGFASVSARGSIASIPGQNGYWIVADYGRISAQGDAPELCKGQLSDCSGFPEFPSPSQIIVGAVATPSGNGLWALGRDGYVWAVGDATFYGDAHLDPQVATGIVATPSGKGYYIVKEDGGVFSFGDAVFYGSTGGNPPGGHHVTGMALSIGEDGKVNGYWLVAEDGGVFTFGKAPFWGSSGGNNGGAAVTSIVSFPAPVSDGPPQRTLGYAWVHENGQVSAVRGAF